MKVQHITRHGRSIIRDTDDISKEVKQHFKDFQHFENGSVTKEIQQTPYTGKITMSGSIAIFDLLLNDELVCTNFCCFRKKDKAAVLEYANHLDKALNGNNKPTGTLVTPEEDCFIYTFIINPLAASLNLLSLAGEIELYIYDALYEGLQKKNSSPEKEESSYQIFKVGEVFPWKEYTTIGDNTIPVFNKKSFDIVISLTGLSPEEIKAFRKEKLETGLFIYKDTPFIYVDFNQFSVDVALNINKLSEEDIENWLNAGSSAVTLFLLEGKTGVLKAQRIIGINFLEEIRDALEAQTAQSIEEVERTIKEVTSKYTTQEIKNRAIKKCFFNK